MYPADLNINIRRRTPARGGVFIIITFGVRSQNTTAIFLYFDIHKNEITFSQFHSKGGIFRNFTSFISKTLNVIYSGVEPNMHSEDIIYAPIKQVSNRKCALILQNHGVRLESYKQGLNRINKILDLVRVFFSKSKMDITDDKSLTKVVQEFNVSTLNDSSNPKPVKLEVKS